MANYFERQRNPACYQGPNMRKQHFEGWYFKVISQDEQHKFAFIPGVFLDKSQPEKNHAFIQVFNGQNDSVRVIRYPFDTFSPASGVFDVKLGPNRFSAASMTLQIAEPDAHIAGELRFRGNIPWPGNWLSPGIMGWYTWVPFMECYHGVVSMDHEIDGALMIDGELMDFTGGRGYIEKDWGQAFPEAWVWCQTNHFDTPGTSLTGSAAIIPWLSGAFLGYIVGLWHEGQLYRFTTYTGAKLVDLAIDDTQVQMVLAQGDLRLSMSSNRTPGGILYAPTLKGMNRTITESLKTETKVHLSRNGNTIFSGTGRHSGFEVAGNLERLIEMWIKTNR